MRSKNSGALPGKLRWEVPEQQQDRQPGLYTTFRWKTGGRLDERGIQKRGIHRMDSRIKNLEKHEYIKENDEFLKKGEREKTVINSKKNKVLYDCHGPVIKQTNR